MITVQRMDPDGWERVRAVRLRALGDSPDAFGSTLEREGSQPAAFWQDRLENRGSATFVASADGADLGIVTGAPYVGRDRSAGLFGMWVAPEARGRGVGDLLVDAVVDWARACGYERVVLEVADENPAAIRLYARKGFEPTGATGTLPAPRTHVREHERALEL